MPPNVVAEFNEIKAGGTDKLMGEYRDTLSQQDFVSKESIGFSTADMMAMFIEPNKSAEGMLPHLRKLYSHIGELIKKYEDSCDNLGSGRK